MDDDAPDTAGFGEAHVGPGRAGVGRLVDAVAHHVGVADGPGFAGARPDDLGVGLATQGADGLHGLGVEDRGEAAPLSVDFQTPPEAAPA